jgi:subfamily B ATP-binding cassette protein HlyB/CyaB
MGQPKTLTQAQDEDILQYQAHISRHESSFHRIVTLLTKHKGTLAGILTASLLLNVMGLVAPRITQLILDRVVPQGDLPSLTFLILGLVFITAFQVSLAIWRRFTLVRMSLKFDRILLGAFAAHLLSLPAHFFKKRQAGDLISRFNEHGHVRHLIAGGMTRAMIDALFVLIYLAIMFLYSVPLALVVSALLLLFALFTLFTGPILKRQHQRLQENRASVESQLIEAVAHIDVIKSMGLEETIQQKWHDLFRNFSFSNYQTQKMRQVLESSCTFVQFLITVALLWCGAFLVIQGALSLGQLVAFWMYTSLALPPLLSMVTLWDEWQQGRVAMGRVQEILDHKCEPQPSAEMRVYLEPIQGHISFNQVVFGYDDSSPVLHKVSFEIEPGERVGLIGRSGSGKTTVARLLLGLYHPKEGQVLIDGVDLRRLDLLTFRRQAAMVLQENLLLSGSISHNIALGDSETNLERIQEAAHWAGAHDFICRLPHGYETHIGEMGLNFSAGERQRISIARALYRNPRILIFDEATSALDAATSQEIQQRLSRILHGRTMLFISHKKFNTGIVDRILALEDGEIFERMKNAGNGSARIQALADPYLGD